jgi:hypothetical protein
MNKSNEVIDTQSIEASQACGNARDPPCETGTTMLAPPVVRMTPQLTSAAEAIRRNTGHHLGRAVLIKAEQLRIVLDIR